MSDPNRFTEFLHAATAGLKKDRELQLDVEAELRSHLEDRQQAALTAGLAPEAAEEEAIRAMGVPAELAAELQRSNEPRMRLRARLRFVAQWLLAPVAIATAVLTTDWSPFRLARTLGTMSDFCVGGPLPSLLVHHLTADQRLVLQGDCTKPTTPAQQRAIWERWPTNRVYLHNYITHLLSSNNDPGVTPAERDAELDVVIAEARQLDPDNARLDYILAGRLLSQAVDSQSRRVKGPDGTAKVEFDITIKDRAKLDAAMALFGAGLAKSEYRRYTRDMALERLAIVGEPRSLVEQAAQQSLVAQTLLPDSTSWRHLAHTTLFYGELLAREGRRSEADIFLNAHRNFVPQIINDAYALIDVLVVGAVTQIAADQVPSIYENLGDAAAAERARLETVPLAAPIRQWRENRRAGEQASESAAQRHAGILAGMLLPGLGEHPTPQELAPSRLLEYVMAERSLLAIWSLGLCLLMGGAGLAALYFRWVGRGADGGMLLLPEISEVLRLLVLGVVLPLAGYYLVTRWLPWNSRELNVIAGGPALLAQLVTVVVLIIGVTGSLVGRIVRRRCRELQLPVPLRAPWGWRIAGVSLLVPLVLAGFLPASWLPVESQAQGVLFWVFLGLVVLALLIGGVYLKQRVATFGRACAAYFGTRARTMIPVFALALILVNVCSQPYLRWAERRYLAADTVMSVDPSGGFTRLETRVTQRLKAELQQAADGLK